MNINFPSFEIVKFEELLTNEPSQRALEYFRRTESYLSRSMRTAPGGRFVWKPRKYASPGTSKNKMPQRDEYLREPWDFDCKELLHACTRLGVNVAERRYDHKAIVKRFLERMGDRDPDAVAHEDLVDELQEWAMLESSWYRGWLLRDSIFDHVNRENPMRFEFTDRHFIQVNESN